MIREGYQEVIRDHLTSSRESESLFNIVRMLMIERSVSGRHMEMRELEHKKEIQDIRVLSLLCISCMGFTGLKI